MASVPVRRRLRRLLATSLLLPVLSIACNPTPPSGSGLACDGKRWIGIKPGGSTCASFLPPMPTSWLAAPLFAGAVTANLDRYCLYRWPSAAPGPSAADVAALTASAGSLKGFAEDCPIIAPLGFPEESSRDRRQSIHAAAGGLTSLPPSPTLRTTRLAVVDNAPDSLGAPGAGPADMGLLPAIQPHTSAAPFGEHGEVLAHLGRDLGCPEGNSGPCPVHVETALALRDGGSPSPGTIGGISGTRGDLAVALHGTVVDWRDDLAGGGEPRLVINLSVGWEDHPDDSDCHVTDPAHLNAPSEAVYDAMAEARCHGALLLGAAGNETGRGSPGGLMCPAHFAQWKPPVCNSDLIDPQFEVRYKQQTGLVLRPPTDVYDPLVHPIGAVDFGDASVAPHRRGSLPKLVAPGFLGVSYEGALGSAQTGSPLPAVAPYPLTGTSVSTMVVSAIAAAAWSYGADRAPSIFMDTIYTKGAALSATAEAAPISTVRRASLCRTLRGMSLLPTKTVCSDLNPGQFTDQSPRLSTSLAASMTAYYASGSSATVSPLSGQTTPLAQLATEAAGNTVSPQPLWPTCPSCGIELGLDAILHIDPPPNVRFGNAYLVTDGQSYALGNLSGKTSYRLGTAVSIAPGSRVYLVWEDANGNAAYAQIPVF
ncbi:MAG: hypothetical protein QM820_14415 [Minicystis sp.]